MLKTTNAGGTAYWYKGILPQRVRDELFSPVVEDNKDTGDIVETLAGIVSESFLR